MKTRYKVQKTIIPNINFKDLSQTHVISYHTTPGKAIENMKKLAFVDARHMLHETTEVTIAQTSDERYPDAWGYANNGIQIKAESKLIQWEVIETI